MIKSSGGKGIVVVLVISPGLGFRLKCVGLLKDMVLEPEQRFG